MPDADSDYLENLWREAFTPPDRLPVWQWAEQHIEGIPYSPIPGRFQASNSPMLKEVMQEMVNPRTRLISIIASVQSSKSTAIEVALCYIVANMPGPTLWLDQNDDDAKDQAEGRLRKIFDCCAPVKRLYPGDRYKLRNTTIHFANGMTLWVAGAYNKSNLQRRSIRWLIGDETWRWPQGHMAEAEARTTAFGWLGKCIFCSQGGFAGDDTHTKYATTDQREWMFTCPHCGHEQPYSWNCVEWDKDCKDSEGHVDFRKLRASAHMRCANCRARFEDRDDVRRDLNAASRFVPQNPNAAAEYVGFHWNALATMGWGMLAELYIRAKIAAKKGDYSQLQQFYQKRLGLPWDDFQEDYHIETAPSDYRMGEPWDREGNISGIPLRIMTVDVQRDSFYLVVRSWANDGSSRMLHCAHVLTWEDVQNAQQQSGVHPSLCFIDSGYSTYEVYAKCAENGWTALMGDRRSTFTHRPTGSTKPVERFYSPKRRINLGTGKACNMHFWSNLNIKDALARLRRNTDGGPVWEVPQNAPQEYLDMLDSEYRAQDKGRWIWKQIGERANHYLDCEAMSVCAAFMLKIVGNESLPAAPPEQDPEQA